RLALEHVLREVGLRQAGVDDQYVDAEDRQLAPQGLAEALNGEFAGRVLAAPRQAALPDDRRDVDHGRLVALFQQGEADAGRFGQAENVDLEDLSQSLFGRQGEMAGGADAGIINQDVEAAEALVNRVGHRLAVGGRRYVGAEDFDAGLTGQLTQERFIAG